MNELSKNAQVPQCDKTAVSSNSIYGYALEIRSINYNGNWFRHYNHKLYRTEDCARDAIYQMKDFKFYDGFEWRVVPLYCH
jgi:hypothetical protein